MSMIREEMEELMMRKIEQRIYSILAPATIQIYPFVTSCERIAKLLFEDEIPIDVIKLHRDIYSVIGRSLSKSPNSISRSVERLLKKMWETSPEAISAIAGKPLDRCLKEQRTVLHLHIISIWRNPSFKIELVSFAKIVMGIRKRLYYI